jgi:GNAT superfamily N-acetyltransferase
MRAMPSEWKRGEYTISTDPDRLDLAAIHGYLRESYWAAGIPREKVEQSIRNSLSFGLYVGETLVGFARVITDYTTFAYVADVFVLASHRGKGLGVWLMEVVRAHPELQNMRRWVLATRDAHDLYRKTGFTDVDAGRFMQVLDPDVYKR